MTDYDLVILGAGSGNMLPSEGFDGMRVAIIERDRFGGTCLNRGCIPSKMLVYAADVAETVRHAGRYGVRAELVGADWKAIRDRGFGRIDPLSDRAVASWRRSGVDVYLGEARFVGPRALEVAGQQIRGKQVVLAVGSRPRIPEIVGLGEVPFHTSDTIMRVETLPKSMVVVGGGYVAAEMSHVFGAFGTEITIVNRGPSLLGALDDDVAQRFTERYQERFDVRLRTHVVRVERARHGVAVHLEGPGWCRRRRRRSAPRRHRADTQQRHPRRGGRRARDRRARARRHGRHLCHRRGRRVGDRRSHQSFPT
jgi:mycothione reductase